MADDKTISPSTEEQLRKHNVKDLRKYISTNEIFRGGLNRLKKSELINKILESDFWKDKRPVIRRPPSPKRPPPKRPTDEQKVQSTKSKKEEPTKEVKTEVKEEKPKRKPRKIKTTEDPVKIISKSADNKLSSIRTNVLKAINEAFDAVVEPDKQIPDTIHPASIEPTQSDGSLVKLKSGKNGVDIGHTVINMYCGGSSHPDFPIPQSVVRGALNAQQLPPQEQKNMGEQLKNIEPSIPKMEGIPPHVIPQPQPHKTQTPSNIRARFEQKAPPKSETKAPPKSETKAPPEAPPLTQPKSETKSETKESSSEIKVDDDPFGEPDDDDEEETESEKRVRLQKEELKALSAFRGKQSAKMDKVRSKLEGIFASRLAQN